MANRGLASCARSYSPALVPTGSAIGDRESDWRNAPVSDPAAPLHNKRATPAAGDLAHGVRRRPARGRRSAARVRALFSQAARELDHAGPAARVRRGARRDGHRHPSGAGDRRQPRGTLQAAAAAVGRGVRGGVGRGAPAWGGAARGPRARAGAQWRCVRRRRAGKRRRDAVLRAASPPRPPGRRARPAPRATVYDRLRTEWEAERAERPRERSAPAA